jgi:serine/threonine protein kinase
MAELKNGDTLDTASFKKVQIKKLLGDGGQGWVYLVDYNGKPMALKWYKPGVLGSPGKFMRNLENNIKKGAPTQSFLWPLDLAKKGDDFGYIMELRPPEYKDFSAILLGRELVNGQLQKLRWPGISPMVAAALDITAGFRALHASGYSYQDLNDGNFFVNLTDPAKLGQVLICDNDNVSEYGFASGIAGKARYMAPEVVLGKTDPNPKTDTFSLAVVLFLLFVNTHPLEGKAVLAVPCMTDAYEKKFYGENPVFIFDPTDTSNEPVPDKHQGAVKRWPFLPQYARDMFIKAFSKQAMKDPALRVMEKDWIQLFVRMRGEVWKCPSCGEVYFADPVNPNPCPSCRKPHNFPSRAHSSHSLNRQHERRFLYA